MCVNARVHTGTHTRPRAHAEELTPTCAGTPASVELGQDGETEVPVLLVRDHLAGMGMGRGLRFE